MMSDYDESKGWRCQHTAQQILIIIMLLDDNDDWNCLRDDIGSKLAKTRFVV